MIAVSLINFEIFFLKILRLGAFWILGSRLFHPIMTHGKKVFLKKLCLTLKWGILFVFLVEKGLVKFGIILKIYFGDWSFKILQKQHSLLYHCMCCRDSLPSSSKSFWLDVPLIAPVMAPLYWIRPFFLEKMHYMLDHR